MICPNDIATLKTDINEKIGQKIIVKVHRKKQIVWEKKPLYKSISLAFCHQNILKKIEEM